MAKELCPRQKRFAEEYPVDLDGTQAAIRAGYSAKTAAQAASRLLKNVNVQRAIMAEHAKRAERVHVDQDFVISGLVENYQRAMRRIPVVDRDGEETGEYRWEGQVANRALELLGKHLAMFTDVKRLDGDLPPMQVYIDEADPPEPDSD